MLFNQWHPGYVKTTIFSIFLSRCSINDTWVRKDYFLFDFVSRCSINDTLGTERQTILSILYHFVQPMIPWVRRDYFLFNFVSRCSINDTLQEDFLFNILYHVVQSMAPWVRKDYYRFNFVSRCSVNNTLGTERLLSFQFCITSFNQWHPGYGKTTIVSILYHVVQSITPWVRKDCFLFNCVSRCSINDTLGAERLLSFQFCITLSNQWHTGYGKTTIFSILYHAVQSMTPWVWKGYYLFNFVSLCS